jgi:hypothetical protein
MAAQRESRGPDDLARDLCSLRARLLLRVRGRCSMGLAMKRGEAVRLVDVERCLQRADLNDHDRLLLTIAHFQLRGRAPDAEQIAIFCGWELRRAENGLRLLSEEGLADKGEAKEPLS